MNWEAFGVIGKATRSTIVGGAFANLAGSLRRNIHDKRDGINSVAVARFLLLENKRQKGVVIEGGDSFADRKEMVIARNAGKKVHDIVFLEPFLVAANM